MTCVKSLQKFYQRKPQGLNGALQDLGIQFEGREHCGKDYALLLSGNKTLITIVTVVVLSYVYQVFLGNFYQYRINFSFRSR